MPEPRTATQASAEIQSVAMGAWQPQRDRAVEWTGDVALLANGIQSGAASADPFVAALRDVQTPVVIADARQDDSPIVFLNPSFSALTGYAPEEIIGRNCRVLQGPGTDRKDVAEIGEAISRRAPIEIELLNYRKDGEPFRNRLRLLPVFDEHGALSFYCASQLDVTLEEERFSRLQRDRNALNLEADRRATDLALSVAQLRFTQQAGRIGSWTLDLETMELQASEGCKENFGRSRDEPFGYDAWIDAIHQDDRPGMQTALEAAISGQTNYDMEYRVGTPNDGIRWIQFRGRASYRADGTPLTIAGISLDVTARRQAEDHRDLLSNEMGHRVRNTLATVHAIVRQTLSHASSLQEAASALDARILSLAKAHDILTRASWDSALMDEVVKVALGPFASAADYRYSFSGPAFRLGSRAALAFAMALHELATNAVKYGAFSTDAGQVHVSWGLSGAGPVETLSFRWEEIGGPPVGTPTRTGFGSRLIEQALAMEIGGQAKIEFAPTGVVFTAEAAITELRKH